MLAEVWPYDDYSLYFEVNNLKFNKYLKLNLLYNVEMLQSKGGMIPTSVFFFFQ